MKTKHNESITSLAEKNYKRLLHDGGGDIFDTENMLESVNEFLNRFPHYASALRLRGLLIDYQISRDRKNGIPVTPEDKRFRIILESYELASAIDPKYTLVLIDLGDYWSDHQNYNKAIDYYNQAILLLKDGHYTDNRDEELELAYIGKIDVLMALQDFELAGKCKEDAINDCPECEYFQELEI